MDPRSEASSKNGIERRGACYHVIGGDERIVNSDELHVAALESHSRHQSSDPSEPYDITNQRISIKHRSIYKPKNPKNQHRYLKETSL